MIEAQINLHATHLVTENDFYYDCLHYKVMDDIVTYVETKGFQTPHQIIKYCIRPFENLLQPTERMVKGNILTNYTFKQLGQLNITGQDLLLWSAPIDLVEQYEIYIGKLDSAFQSEIFYKCESPWFGLFCQYTFNSDDTFNTIVQKTFRAKIYNPIMENTEHVLTNITNLTCYIYLKCNRGPTPICLDWREICNGQIDCQGSGIDEINCFQLEINECESNEYQCQNGMCVSEEFFHGGLYDPECLDSTDESYYKIDDTEIRPFIGCSQDPSFRCEDAFHPHHDLEFACGDGEQNSLQIFAPTYVRISAWLGCRNGRTSMLRNLLLLNAEQANLTYDCWAFMSCLTYAGTARMCKNLCNSSYCYQSIQSICNVSSYMVFPLLPISPSHVQSGYWTARTIFYSFKVDVEKSPDFYCYDAQLCPFFSPTFKIDHRTCVNHSDISLYEFDNPIRLFDRCLTIDESGNQTDCFHPSLFHCPGTHKCISKRRLVDGVVDCYGGADETYTESCQLDNKYRFQCTSENKCIPSILLRDGIKHCKEGEDGMAYHQATLYYLNLCNGYANMAPVLIDGQNETDETNCEEWPCDNQYTRCDKAWTCPNGVDEIDCNRMSKCYPGRHECVSPTDFEVICLPINRSGDGKMDCLGGTDERPSCPILS